MFGDDDNDDVCTWYISEQQREEGGGEPEGQEVLSNRKCSRKPKEYFFFSQSRGIGG